MGRACSSRLTISRDEIFGPVLSILQYSDDPSSPKDWRAEVQILSLRPNFSKKDDRFVVGVKKRLYQNQSIFR
jgi:hypothetical protein